MAIERFIVGVLIFALVALCFMVAVPAKADFPVCVNVNPGPLIVTHPTAEDPHPRMPDNA